MNAYNTIAKNLGSFGEIVKDGALLSVLTSVLFQRELNFDIVCRWGFILSKLYLDTKARTIS